LTTLKILNAIKLVTRAFKVIDMTRPEVATWALQVVELTPSGAMKVPPIHAIHRARDDKVNRVSE
jgi:hypothetical protein